MLRGFFVRGPQRHHLLALSNWLRAHTYHSPLLKCSLPARSNAGGLFYFRTWARPGMPKG
jgi:hypothetical protein